MVAANREWLFTRDGWIDTWMYFGFFRHYNIAVFLDENKKIARLPWILIGFLANHIAPTVTASLILHLGLFAAGVLCFYLLAAHMFGRCPAIIAALTYLTWAPMHGFGGWDYHNTLLPLVFLSAYFVLLTALRRADRPATRFAVVGVLFALAIHTNILVALLIPGILVRVWHEWTLLPAPERTLQRVRLSLAGLVTGALAITLALGLIDVAFGRTFFFFGELISRSAFLIEHQSIEDAWWLPWSSLWWISEIHTPMFDAMIVLGIACAVAGRGWNLRRVLASSAACMLVEFALGLSLFGLGQAFGHPLLQPFYMLMPVTMPMFLALAAMVGLVAEDFGQGTQGVVASHATAFAAFAAVAFGVQFIGQITIAPNLLGDRTLWSMNLSLFIMLLGFAVATVIARTGPIPYRSWVALAVLAVTLGQVNAVWPNAADDRGPYDAWSRCRAHVALLSAVAGADDLLFPRLLQGQNVLPWFRRGESIVDKGAACRLSTSDLADPLFAMGYGVYVGYPQVGSSPTMPQSVVGQLVPGRDVIAFMSNSANDDDRLLRILQAHNPSWQEVETHRIGADGLYADLHVIAAQPTHSVLVPFSLSTQNRSTFVTAPSGDVFVSLPNTAWTYVARVHFPYSKPANVAGITMRVRLIRGTAAVGILNRTGTAFLSREVLAPAVGLTIVELRVPNWAEAGPLEIETGDGVDAGQLEISSLGIMEKNAVNAVR